MDASVELHLKTIDYISKATKIDEFPPIGEVVSHLIAIVSIQERRISTLEQTKEVR